MAQLCAAAMAGDAATARGLNDKLMPLHKALFIESNPIPVKWALHEMGLIPDGIRLPLTWLSPAATNPCARPCASPACLPNPWSNNA